MVDVRSALVSSQNTTVVVGPLGGISADGQRSEGGKGLVDLGFISSDRDDLVDVSGRGALARSASSVLGGVRVALVGVESSLLLNPSESFSRISSVASLVSGIAINDFLRGEGLNRLSSHQDGGFDCFSGGEGPARSTLLLILDRSGHSFGDPVNRLGRGLFSSAFGNVGDDGRSTARAADESVQAGLFAFAPVRELGEAEGGTKSTGLGSSVHFGDLGSIHFEVFESGSAFYVVVGLVPEASVLIELSRHSEGTAAWGVDQSAGGSNE